MEKQRLTIEQLEIGKSYFSEWKRERYKIIWTDRKTFEWITKKVLKVKTENSNRQRSKSTTYLTKSEVDNNFFHLSTNNPID